MFLIETLFNHLAGLVKFPGLDKIASEVVSKVNSTLDNITAKYFDSKPQEFVTIEQHLNKIQQWKTGDVLSLDIHYFDSYTDGFKCKECESFYDEHMLNMDQGGN